MLDKAEYNFSRNDLPQTIKNYQDVLVIDPDNISALLSISDCFIKMELYKQAEKYAERAYYLYKDIEDTAAVNLSCVLMEQKNYERCIAILERAKISGSTNDLVFNNLGYTYFLTGRFHSALDNYNISIKLLEENPLAYCNRGVVKYFVFNDEAEGVKDLGLAHKYGDFEAGMILQNIVGDRSLLS